MCVIIEIPRGMKFPENKMTNAVSNNPHGFGIVWLDDNGVEVQHFISDKDNDPADVMRALEEHNKTADAYLHLRYKTKGTVSRENTHPFTVISDDRNEVYMMHNGTFSGLDKYGPVINAEESDSSQFNRVLLQPLLNHFKFEDGLIDPSDPMLKVVLDKFVDGGNRLLMIGNNGLPGFFGNWSKVTYSGDSFFASNNTYFDRPNARTPYQYPNANHGSAWTSSAKKSEPKVERKNTSGVGADVIPFGRDYETTNKKAKDLKDMETKLAECMDLNIKSSELSDLINNMDPYITIDEASAFSNLTTDEVLKVLQTESENDEFLHSFAQLFLGIASYVNDLALDLEIQENKLKSATNIIAGLKRQQALSEQQAQPEHKVG